jgi:hypothetical protein
MLPTERLSRLGQSLWLDDNVAFFRRVSHPIARDPDWRPFLMNPV